MTKKFMSLLLAVVMVIGLMPVMSIQAETSASSKVLYEDFESYDDKTQYNADFDRNTDDNDVGPIAIGYASMGEIVTMTGYYGTTTKALKLSTQSDASWSTSYGGGKQTFTLNNAPTSGKYVTEFKIYVPEDVDSGGEPISRTFYKIYAKPFVMSGSKFGVGRSLGKTNQYNLLSSSYQQGKWYKLTYVQDLTAGNASMYVNDVLELYNSTDTDIQLTTTNTTMGIYSRHDSDTYGDASLEELKEKYIIFDDFNFYVPEVTSAASTYAGLPDVAVTAQPKVTFTEMLLNAEINDVATISDANIIMTTSDGAQIVPKTWEVSEDNKSITIKPNAVLEKGASYRVKLTGLKDMYDVLIPNYEFTFTTQEESPIVIKSGYPTFQKVSLTTAGTPEADITSLEKGYIRANLTVQNTSTKNKTQSLIMIAVLKDGDEIIGFQFKEGTLAPTEELTFDGGFYVTDADTQKIELFVWNSLSGMTNLTDKITFDKTGLN